MNHIATGTAPSLDGELLPPHGSSSGDEDGGGDGSGVDGGAFRGHFPAPAGCRNRDSCPPDLGFAMAAALELFSYRGFLRKGFRCRGFKQAKRQRRGVNEATTPQGGAGPALAAPPCHLGPPGPPSGGSRVFWMLPGKIGTWALISSNSENISLLGFLKPKTAENRNWHFGILLIGQFQKTHKYDI